MRSRRTFPPGGVHHSRPRFAGAVFFRLHRRSIPLRQPTGLTMLPGGTPPAYARAELCGNRITVCHDRAANDVALVLTRFAGGGLPGSVMGPSTENTPRSASMSTREERPCRFVFVHRLKESAPCYRLHGFIILGRPFSQPRVRCQP